MTPATQRRRGPKRSTIVTEHAEALRQHIDEIVAACLPCKPGTVAAFIASRGATCDSSVRAYFRQQFGCSPQDYYLDAVTTRVRALRAERPAIKRGWLVLHTGATEAVIGRVLRALDGGQEAA